MAAFFRSCITSLAESHWPNPHPPYNGHSQIPRGLAMPILPTFMLPKNILTALRSGSNHVQSSALLAEIAQSDPEQIFKRMETS